MYVKMKTDKHFWKSSVNQLRFQCGLFLAMVDEIPSPPFG